MKRVYSRISSVTSLILFLIFSYHLSYSQCSGGGPSGQTAYDTTIAFGSGIVTTQVRFPKFDPSTGMVTCVRLCVTIKGIIDTVAFENLSNAPQTGSYTYTRKDTITGPGIPTFLSSSANIISTPVPLAATDGFNSSGGDFYSNGPDTVLTRVLCSNVNDSATIAQFYGLDSVTYNYSIDANVTYSVTGGNAATLVLSSALVNFHFEYCTCPPLVLPLNIHQFSVTKLTTDKAELKWTGFDDPYTDYHYEAQVSRDGHNFISIGSFPKNTSNSEPYRTTYRAVNGESGLFYFRIKQAYSSGYSKYSNIRQMELKKSDFPIFTVYPNPSNGIVGIKFDNSYTGRLNIQIYSSQGQTMVMKDISAVGLSYAQVATLRSGVYWMKLTDVKTQATCVNQLLIK